jgi:alkyldihydroxyacetonephosphate synthase
MSAGPLPSATREGLQLARELSALLGGNAVSCAPGDLAAASRDGWTRLALADLHGQRRFVPTVVASPADAEQVAAVIKFAAQRRVPVVPIGGDAGGNGAALAVRGGIALDLKRLSMAPRIDVAARTVEVQAGVTLQKLEEALGAVEMTIGELPPKSAQSTIGGFLATRSGGPSSGQLGKAEDLLLALEAVDGTGTRLHTHDGPSRGLDLAQLLLGSEGTLAVFTKALLRISRRPKARALLGLRFHSMAVGMRALQAVMRSGLRPSITRLLDPLSAFVAGLRASDRPLSGPLRALLTSGQQEAIRSALRAPRLLNGLTEALGGHALLLLQFDGHGARAADEAAEEASIAKRICEQIGTGAAVTDAQVAMALGKPGGRLQSVIAASAFVEVIDVAATWEKLPAVLGAIRRAAAPHGLIFAQVGCAYLEGASLEMNLIGPAGTLGAATRGTVSADDVADELAQVELRGEQALANTLSAALEAGATLSHSSGIGIARQLLLPSEHGEGMRQLRALKRAFDPNNVLNPGKLLL